MGDGSPYDLCGWNRRVYMVLGISYQVILSAYQEICGDFCGILELCDVFCLAIYRIFL